MLPKLVETLELFIKHELEHLDQDVYEVYICKATALEYKGYSKNTIRSVFKPGEPIRELVDLLCLYAAGKNYVQCVQERLLPNAVAEYAQLKSFIKDREVNWDNDIKTPTTELSEQHIQEELIRIVRSANDAEFNAYQKLPDIFTADIEKYIWTEGSAYKRIFNILATHQKKGWAINNEGNPSDHNEYGIWIEKLLDKEAILKTEEYWYLRWFSWPLGKYARIYNEQNVQTWQLLKKGEEWKVMSTYYPRPRKKLINIFYAIGRRIFRWLKEK